MIPKPTDPVLFKEITGQEACEYRHVWEEHFVLYIEYVEKRSEIISMRIHLPKVESGIRRYPI